MTQNAQPIDDCGCSAGVAGAGAAARRAPQPASTADLELLIPIAVVIAGGCEPCARRMVQRAVDGGASPRQVAKTLGLVAHLRGQQCFADSVGPQVIARMQQPLATARSTLRQLAA